MVHAQKERVPFATQYPKSDVELDAEIATISFAYPATPNTFLSTNSPVATTKSQSTTFPTGE